MQYWTRDSEQSKEIKQNWTGPENLDISFWLIFDRNCQIFIAGRETRH